MNFKKGRYNAQQITGRQQEIFCTELYSLVLFCFLWFRLETVTEETLRVASMLLSSQTFREVDVVDFDYHFNDITRDWRNLPINDLLQKCTWWWLCLAFFCRKRTNESRNQIEKDLPAFGIDGARTLFQD